MKKTLALLCAFLILVTIGMLDFSAALRPDIMGDIDCNCRVDVTDATAVQKHVAGIQELVGAYRYLADVDDDLRLTVKDATAIQKYVAGLDASYSVGEDFYQESDEMFYCSHLSGRAWVGEEITFSTNGLGRYYRKEAYAHRLYINDELVAEGKTNYLTHVFLEPGIYDVKIEGYTSFDTDGVGYSYTWYDYEVTVPATQDEVVIKNLQCAQNPDSAAFYVDEGPFEFEVTAQGGSGEYEYLFKIDDIELIPYYLDFNTMTIDFSEFFVPQDEWDYYYGEHTVSVCVRDVHNNSDVDVYCYNIYVAKYRPPA